MAFLSTEDLLEVGYVIPESRPSNEGITPQLGDPAMARALAIMKEIKVHFGEEGDFESSKQLWKKHGDLIQDLSSTISNRIGINIEFICETEKDFYTYYTGPEKNTGFADGQTIGKNYREIEDFLASYKYQDPEAKAFYKKFKQLVDNVEKTDKQLYDEGIIVDDNKAKVMNLSQGVKAVINIDFKNMFNSELEFTPREALAVILHEVGHLYSFYACSYKTYRTVVTLQDNLVDLAKKESDVRKALLISYKKATNDRSIDNIVSEKDDYVSVTVGVLNKIVLRYSRDLTAAGSTSKEKYADSFAVRWGYGVDLAKGIDKIIKVNGSISHAFDFWPKPRSGGFLIRLMQGLVRIIWQLFTLPSQLFLFVISSTVAFVTDILTQTFSNDYSRTLVYEKDKRRLDNIKTEMLYVIKNTKSASKEARIQFEKDLKQVETLIQIANEYDDMLNYFGRGVVDALYSFFKSNRDAKERVNLSYELEKLVSNDLHGAVNSLKTLA